MRAGYLATLYGFQMIGNDPVMLRDLIARPIDRRISGEAIECEPVPAWQFGRLQLQHQSVLWLRLRPLHEHQLP